MIKRARSYNREKTPLRVPLIIIFALAALPILFVPASAGTRYSKTPDDVYGLAMVLKEQVKALRARDGVEVPWPELQPQRDKASRHVLQKAIEVLTKIGRIRVIKGMGALAVPPYPSRDITPDEVHDMVERLSDEMDLLVKTGDRGVKKYAGKTSDDIYLELWAVSRALDPVLGVRGFNPSDVYSQSVRVIEEVTFLRLSQGLPLDVERPELTEGKHPNHALKAAYGLLASISGAERNLWLQPAAVPEVPRRVIEPYEVYDALQVVLAEMQRIKFRLGIERNFESPLTTERKTSDDVIQNLVWASRMMPEFPPGRELKQRDQALLEKTPNHVYAMTEHIIEEVKIYRSLRGVQTVPRIPPEVKGLEPMHVYQKALECLEKLALIRVRDKLGTITVPSYPLREITPTEVYDLTIRLDYEFDILYRQTGTEPDYAYSALKSYTDKTPDDVYRNMWRISYLLDTLMGGRGYTPDDVYAQAEIIVAELGLIGRKFGYDLKTATPALRPALEPKDVLAKSREVIDLLNKVQKRTGHLEGPVPDIIVSGEVTPNDLINEVRLVHAEVIHLKVHLGITETPKIPKRKADGKTPGHVYGLMDKAGRMLSKMLKGGN
ncbi:MAG: hypothetical protein V3W31_07525 [Thermodesulfobacteriota bacterium]